MKYILALICSFCFFTNLAIAEHEDHDQAKKFLEDLDLTPEQSKKMKELRANKKDFKEEMESIKSLREEMENLLNDPNSSDSEVLAKSKALGEQMSKIHENRINNILAMKKILTPEQFSKLSSKMREKKQEHREKFKDHAREGGKDRKGLREFR